MARAKPWATLVVVRHGQSVWNQQNIFTGWVDVDLSEQGVDEAREAGASLREMGFVPDIAFTSVEKLPLDAWNTGYAEVMPDLVVEIASPSDSRREVHDKARMWLSYGVRLVWVVHPGTRTVDVHRPDHVAATLGDQDSLDGMDVLPGFSCDVSAVFGRPAPEQSEQD